MTSLLEFNARAALCRRFARQEPGSRHIWLAEAERWSRLTKEDTDQPEGRHLNMSAGHINPWRHRAMRESMPKE